MYYIVFTITDTNDIEFLKSIVYKSALNINDIELIITDMTEEIKNDYDQKILNTVQAIFFRTLSVKRGLSEEFFTDASQSGLDQNDSEILGQTEMELIKKEVLLAGGNYNELMKRLKSGLSYDELVKKGYISALDRVLADEYSYTARDGEVLGKKEDLEGYKNNRNILRAANLSDQSVRVLARNVAVETGTIHYTGRNSGKPFDLRKRYTTTWIRRDGRWQIVADHTSKIEN